MPEGHGQPEAGRLAHLAAKPGSVVLILGGVRSGKSSLAERLAGEMGRRVLYLATAEALDEEMRQRAAAHRLGRPARWETVEEPLDPARVVAELGPGKDVVLLDCLTMLVSNLLLRAVGDGGRVVKGAAAVEEEVLAAVNDLVAATRRVGVKLIVVSNEVGMGVIPEHPLGRVYRDVLGRANQGLAAQADVVCLMVAGLPWVLKSHTKSHTFNQEGQEGCKD